MQYLLYLYQNKGKLFILLTSVQAGSSVPSFAVGVYLDLLSHILQWWGSPVEVSCSCRERELRGYAERKPTRGPTTTKLDHSASLYRHSH